MSNIIDDEFKVMNYIHRHNDISRMPIVDLSNQIEEAIKWSVNAMRTIIIPTGDLEDLESQWIKFNDMPKKHRRESDWKSLELFGVTNQTNYETMRSTLLGNDIKNEIEKEFDDNIKQIQGSSYETLYGNYRDMHTIQAGDIPIDESYIDTFMDDDYYDNDEVEYTTEDVEKARRWSSESNRIIIIPTRTLGELESLWDAFGAMHHKHCRESDWMSLELFGITNLKHYEYLKNQFLKNDINAADSDKYGSIIEYTTNPNISKYFAELCRTSTTMHVAKSLLEMSLPRKSIYEERIVSNVVNTTIDNIIGLSEILPNYEITYGDMPYFSPEDMIDMGVSCDNPVDNYYGVSADNLHINDKVTVAEWFELYKATHKGFYVEYGELAADWVQKVRSLMHGLKHIKESGDEVAINARMQSILELGWNPNIEFTDKARKIARECAQYRITNKNSVTRVIDLRGFSVPENKNITLNEDTSVSNDKKLYPVYIVMSEGKSNFSIAIKRMTHSKYSHASISFDSSMEHMYSFGLIGTTKNKNNGFREENIKEDVPLGGRIDVFVFFVPKHIYDKITNMVYNLRDNADNTSYSLLNILTFLFNIPYNNDTKMICSQFVSRCLKVAGIDIIGKDPSLTSPEDLNKAAINEKRIYSVYRGIASSYDPVKIERLVQALMKNAEPLKESFYFTNEASYLTGIITNINNPVALKQMRPHIDLVTNSTTRRILEEVLFDSLTVKPYCEFNNSVKDTNNNPSLDFMTKMIHEYYKPII